MFSPKHALILILLILFQGFSFSQQILSQTAQQVCYRIPYIQDGGNIYRNGNTLLKEMAKEVLREPWLVKVNFSCSLVLLVEQVGQQNQLRIVVRDKKVNGDTIFRKFSVSSVLQPSHISMKLKWANRADTSGYVEETVPMLPLPPNDSQLVLRAIPSFNPLVDTLLVREIEFSYDSLSVKAVFDRIGLIHDYYASGALLDSLDHFTLDLDLSNHKLLPFNYLKIEEACRVIKQIDLRNFRGRLLSEGSDPSGLVHKYDEDYRYSRTLVYNFIDELHKTGMIPWDGETDRLAQYFTDRVFSYVRRSFLMDQQQGAIYNDCLEHLYDQSDFPAEENVATTMLAKMFPDARPDTVARFVSEKIYGSFRKTAHILMQENRFAEAFAMLDNARRFLKANPFIHDMVPDEPMLTQAAQGICDSYVGIAKTCITGHKYEMAAAYLAKAGTYAASHASFNISDSAYRTVFSELFFLRNADCDQLLEAGKFAEALDCYGRFEQSYSSKDIAVVSDRLNEKLAIARIGLSRQSEVLSENALKQKNSDTALYYYEKAQMLRKAGGADRKGKTTLDSLAPAMGHIKFEQIVRDGTLALDKRQFTLAVNRLNAAKILAGEFKITLNDEFDSIYRRAMKNLLIVQLSSSQKKIWANEFDSAHVALKNTEAAGFDYGFLNDPEFSAALENFRTKMREQSCRNLQDSVDLRMIRADRSVALRNFIKVVAYLKEASALLHNMPECGIPFEPVTDSLAKYENAAAYQQKHLVAKAYVTTGNYEEAIKTIDENQKAFQTQHLDRLALKPESTFEVIGNFNNAYLTSGAMNYYYAKDDFQLALKLLLLAHDQDMGPGIVAVMQEQLGVKFATGDHMKNPADDPLQNVTNYIPADRWFDNFRSAYITEWNRLDKN